MSRLTEPRPRYDRVTIALHWLTAVLVIVLFALAEIWGYLPRGTPLRRGFQALHISLGILLALVFVARLAWRLTQGRSLPAATTGLQNLAATAANWALYLLLAAQIGLGFLFRWAQGEPFLFFGLFSIPSPMTADRPTAHSFGELHNTIAWVIIVLAGCHAAAALLHHYVLRDGLLRRMLPGTAPR
ncbi:MAG: cytochrome b [Aliidongia sp.]